MPIGLGDHGVRDLAQLSSPLRATVCRHAIPHAFVRAEYPGVAALTVR